MRTVKPKWIGLTLAGLGATFHLVTVVRVVLGQTQPHALWSLNFPQTATLIISATVIGGFLIGYILGLLWNRAVGWPVKYRTLAAAALVLLVAAGGGVFALFLRPIEVQITRIEPDAAVQVFGLGTVEARVTSKVGFKVAGILADLRADVGDMVTKGAVLARLDDREQTARIARMKAAREQAEASRERANASLERALANYGNAKAINERRQALLETKITSVEAAQTAKAVEDTTRAEVNVAKGDILVSNATINDVKAQQQQEAVVLDFHTLLAPYDALVTARQRERGTALAAGEPVFTLIDPQSVWVLAYIDESKSGEIKVGNPADIVLRSLPRQIFHGRVARIEPEGDRVNEERRVQVAFDQLPPDYHIGEQAEVYITTVRLAQAILVPAPAITGVHHNRGTAWTLEDGRLQRRDVTLGHRLLDGRYEVTGGIPAGAAVVSRLTSGLRIGRAATVAGR
ncbi:efflux RND transporter periplasmic adaptor subunit [Xanthobacteraceae bacterium Astr-EGSB]|uniref:efflux RND transporter periplasmic adaptor subunit n=1 Tax=Astrobacterium formosum TaxID=3069710 RepID=UPI0027B60BDB|nr:efflux RND transporter periplasmic adaptor subunit [Xanthobacteraceae bacterium Astr-EGSB]